MPLMPLTSLDDDRLWPYRDLTDRQLESWGNRFVVESERLVRRLLATDIPVESILISAQREAHVRTWAPPDLPVYVLPDAEMTKVVGYKIHSGVVACAVRKPWPTLEALLAQSGVKRAAAPEEAAAGARGATLLVCPQLKNTENLGAIARISAAFGVTGLLLGETCCDPFCRRTIRVSMGTVFRLPIRKSDDIAHDLRRLREEFAFQLLGTVLDEDAAELRTLSRPLPARPGQTAEQAALDRVALLMGHEVSGLEPEIVRLCDRKVIIPMHLGTDSLNVSVATAVFLYHLAPPGGVMALPEAKESDAEPCGGAEPLG